MAIWTTEIKDLEKLYESIKGQSPDLEKELERLIKADDENMILLYSRRCLEVIITDLCECELKRPRKTEPLKGIIDKLHKEGKVPTNIISSMHGLNELSTYGTHPKDFDPEQVKPVLVNLDIIISWYMNYKKVGTDIRLKPSEEISQETQSIKDVKKSIQIPKKRSIVLLSGLFLLIMVVVAILFLTKIISSGKQMKELEKSIAVLPFENMSDDTEYIWFGDAMTDEIIMQLYKIEKFVVRSRTSVIQYKGTTKTIPLIGKELNVNYIIEGSAQRFENKVRIRVQLLNAVTDDHLWGETYESDWKDILSLQSEIATQIADKLKTVLTPEEKDLIDKSQTKNPEAYDLYLQGRLFWNKRTEEGLKKSVEYFEKSIAEDSKYSLAYAGLTDAYMVQTVWGFLPRDEGFNKAKTNALRALDIDKNLSEAHATLGCILYWSEWKWEEAKKEFLIAIELNPKYAFAHSYYSELLAFLRQNDQARIQINYAIEIEPYMSNMYRLSSINYYYEGKFNESLNECRKLLELDPDFKEVYWTFFNNYVRLGEDLKAVESLQKIMLSDSLNEKNAALIKKVYDQAGIKGIFNWLIESELKKPISASYNLALWNAILNNKEKALDWLERAFEERSINIIRINSNPYFDNLRSETRFKALIDKLGLSGYAKKD